MSAVSMKFTPASAALSKILKDSCSSACLPKVPVPKQSRDTVRPVRAKVVNFMGTPSNARGGLGRRHRAQDGHVERTALGEAELFVERDRVRIVREDMED